MPHMPQEAFLQPSVEENLTPIEATRVMGLIDSYRRILELTEIENRLKVLEDEFAST